MRKPFVNDNSLNKVRHSLRKTPVWVHSSGTPLTRIRKAIYYLSRMAWVPSDARDGGKALLIIVCNLRRYYQLQPTTSVTLIRRYYNPRCVSSEGHYWGWCDQDILKKYRQAGRRGMYPTLGAKDPKAAAKVKRMEIQREIMSFWKKFIIPGGCCTPSELRQAFVHFRGGRDITANMLSRSVKIVIGEEPVRPFGKRLYRGFHIAETLLGCIQDKQERTQQACSAA